MSDDTPSAAAPKAPAPPEFTSEALREWGEYVEIVLRSLAHALNNRAAALSAVIELAREPDDEPAVTSSILTSELERVRELVEIVRTVGPPRGGTEAFAPRDAAEEALAVLKLYAEQRSHSVTIDAGSAPPTRLPRWMFVRSLIALGAAASSAETASRATIRIVLREEGEWLVAGVEAGRGTTVPQSRYAAELARAMGGGPLDDGQSGFRVPTLAALRQREAL